MTNQQKQPNLDLLEHIQKVDAPPFLLTRIQHRLENTYRTQFSPRVVFGLGVSLTLIFTLNVAVLIKYNKETKTENNLAQSMNLIPNNSLYK
jgi:hypothetical protein